MTSHLAANCTNTTLCSKCGASDHKSNAESPCKNGPFCVSCTVPGYTCYFNNYVLDSQDLCPSSLTLSSRNLSLIFSDVFSIFQAEYLKLGLHFNSAKSEIVLFNWKNDLLNSVKLGNSLIQRVDHLVYLVYR